MPSVVLAAAVVALQSYTGAGSCGASACHGAPRPRAETGVRQDEYITWVVKDRHAQAWRTLTEERSRVIARNLRLPGPPEQTGRCLSCHAVNAAPDRRARTFDISDGVACEACHGPAEGWLGPHVTPGWTHAQSVSAGMTDLRDLSVRARTCLACHLGDEDREVDHALIAAGHPDLVFELDTFGAAMPAHGRADKAAGPRAWAAGQVVQLAESLEHLDRRLERKARPAASEASAAAGWPEFAEYECFACHHPLVKDSWRLQRPAAGPEPPDAPGTPLWNPSRRYLALALLEQVKPESAAQARADLASIALQMRAPAPDAAQIAAASRRLRPLLEEAAAAPFPAESSRALLRALSADAEALSRAGYRTAEQAAMAFDTLSRPAQPAPLRKAIDALFDDLKDPARYDPRAFAEHLRAAGEAGAVIRWAKVVDQTRCIGCHACTTACKSENEVPVGVTRTYVKYVDVGIFPLARRAFQVTRCNQCDQAPCTTACPTTAMFRRPDGIVDFDKSVCIGCKACIAACPYDAIFMNPEDHSAEKCNFCAHRIDGGLEPACVVVCPTEAILVGDMNDPGSKVARIVGRDVTAVRRPEKETYPKLFYKGAHAATLDPLAASRPEGGLFVWSEQGSGPDLVTSGYPAALLHSGAGAGNSSAAAMLSYDVPHRAPWDWRVSLYTVTKSIAAGVYLVGWLLGWNTLGPAVPVLGLLFLAVTGALLIADLDHPERFYLIFTRPQWKSWLVRGGFILAAYGAVLVAHGAATFSRQPEAVQAALSWAGVPLALLAAAYTGWLFAQAKGRDLWQNPLLPPHLCLQALLAGAAALLPWAQATGGSAVRGLLVILFVSSFLHLALVAGEMTLPHATAHAHLAAREIVRGRWSAWFWSGMALSTAGIVFAVLGGASSWGPSAATLAALAGLLAFEHAYVQGAQSVPLA